MTVTDPNTIALAVVATIGGVVSALATGYGSYRKINKEYGIDEIESLKHLKADLEAQIKAKEVSIDAYQKTIKSLGDMIIELNEQILKLNKQHVDDNQTNADLAKRIETLIQILEAKHNDPGPSAAVS